jgi:hypothetical protein
VAWSGHRPELFAHPERARALVWGETRRLLPELGPDLLVLSGGQRGVDLWAAAAARDSGLALRLLLPAPPRIFCVDWPLEDVDALSLAIDHAEDVRIFGSRAAEAAGYDARNRALAAECDLLIVVWSGLQHGGTFFTLTEARRLGKPIREHHLSASGHRPGVGERGI